MKGGRHMASGPPGKRPPATVPNVQDGDDPTQHDLPGARGLPEDEAARGTRTKKLALYVVLALCIAFIAWVAWGFLQFDHAIENPHEGDFSGWQCDADHDCGS